MSASNRLLTSVSVGILVLSISCMIASIIFVSTTDNIKFKPANMSYWHSPHVVEVCDNVRLDWVEEFYQILPGTNPKIIEESPVCLCDLGSDPLQGHTEIVATTLQRIQQISLSQTPTLGLLVPRYFEDQVDVRISSCMFVPLSSEGLTEDSLRRIYAHEIGHDKGFAHAYVKLFFFDMQAPYHLMADDHMVGGWSTRGMK